MLNFKASQSISLEPGFETEPGATFTTEIINICQGTKSMHINIPAPIIIGNSEVCEESIYKSEKTNDDVIEWKLTGEKTNIIAYGNEFTTPSELPQGQYSLHCTYITPIGEATSTRTIKVICKPEIREKVKLPLSEDNSEIIVYPNPCKDNFYISINSIIAENTDVIINIYDVIKRNIYSDEVVYNKRIILNLFNEPNGVYFIKVICNEKEYNQKIIKY